jgi:hypothetical protein
MERPVRYLSQRKGGIAAGRRDEGAWRDFGQAVLLRSPCARAGPASHGTGTRQRDARASRAVQAVDYGIGGRGGCRICRTAVAHEPTRGSQGNGCAAASPVGGWPVVDGRGDGQGQHVTRCVDSGLPACLRRRGERWNRDSVMWHTLCLLRFNGCCLYVVCAQGRGRRESVRMGLQPRALHPARHDEAGKIPGVSQDSRRERR